MFQQQTESVHSHAEISQGISRVLYFSIFSDLRWTFPVKAATNLRFRDIFNCSSANPLPVPGLDATNSTSTGIHSISEKQQSLQMSSLYLQNFQMGSDQPRENCSPWGESVLPLLWQLLQQEVQPPQPFETRQRVS
jgi:hypothetical protein